MEEVLEEGFSVYFTFNNTNDNTREDGLLERIARALEWEGIATGNTRLNPRDKTKLFIPHEDGLRRSLFHVTIEPGSYTIYPDEQHNAAETNIIFNKYRTPMETEQIESIQGKTGDFNKFMNRLEYILSFHYPSAVRNGSLKEVMNKFRRNPEQTAERKPDVVPRRDLVFAPAT